MHQRIKGVEPLYHRRRSNRVVILAAVLVIVLSAAALFSQISSDYLSGDGSQYLSVADHLLAGEGLTTTTLVYPSQLDQGLPAHQTIWPPGLPIAAAAVALGLSIDAANAIGIVNIAAHTAAALLLLWAAVHLLHSKLIAAALGFGYMLYWASWSLALSGMAEPLFIAALIGAAACLIKSDKPDSRGAPWLIGASILMAAAILVRYQAVPFVAAFGAGELVGRLRETGPVRAFFEAGLAVLPAVIAFGAVVARNFWAVGSIRGGSEASEGYSAQEIGFFLLSAGHELLGGEAGPLAEAAAVAGLLALLLIGVIVFFLQRRPLPGIAGKEALLVFCVLGTALNLVLILVRLASTSTCCFLPARFLLPSVPLLLIALMALAPRQETEPSGQGAAGRDNMSRAVRGLAIICALAVAIVLVTNSLRQIHWLETRSPPARLAMILKTPYEGETLRNFLADKASLSSPLLSNQSQALYALLRKPTIGVPMARFATKSWTSEDIQALAARFGVAYLVAFPKIPYGPSRDQDYVLQMLDHDPEFLTPLLVTGDIALFRVSAN